MDVSNILEKAKTVIQNFNDKFNKEHGNMEDNSEVFINEEITLDNVMQVKRRITEYRKLGNDRKNFLPYKYKIPSEKQSIINTPNGDIITFKYDLNIEDVNRGWVMNKLTMFINGYEAGYLKFSYIPELYWHYYKGNIARWMEQENKVYSDTYEENSREYKIAVLKEMHSYRWGKGVEIYDKIKDNSATDEDIEREFQNSLAFYEKKYKNDYENSKKYFFENPLIDFSAIYDMEEVLQFNFHDMDIETKNKYKDNIFNYKFGQNVDVLDIPEEFQIEFRGKGFSKYLYMQAAKWVGMNGHKLNAGLLNDKSTRVWESIMKKYPKKFHFSFEENPFDKNKKRKSITSSEYFKIQLEKTKVKYFDFSRIKEFRKEKSLIQKTLTDYSEKLLKKEWIEINRQEGNHPLTGHCYVAAETVYHLFAKDLGFKPQVVSNKTIEPDKSKQWTHWYLKHPESNEIIDFTKEQFNKKELKWCYENGKNCGFLTTLPSKRTQFVLNEVNKKLNAKKYDIIIQEENLNI